MMSVEEKLEIALAMLAGWCNAVSECGTGWDDWDEYYKDAMYRDGPLREDLDTAIDLDRQNQGYDPIDRKSNDLS